MEQAVGGYENPYASPPPYVSPPGPYGPPNTNPYGPPPQNPNQPPYGPPPQNPNQPPYGPPPQNAQNPYGPPPGPYGPYGPPPQNPQNPYGPPPGPYGPYGPPQNPNQPPYAPPPFTGYPQNPQNPYGAPPVYPPYGPPPVYPPYGPPPVYPPYGQPSQAEIEKQKQIKKQKKKMEKEQEEERLKHEKEMAELKNQIELMKQAQFVQEQKRDRDLRDREKDFEIKRLEEQLAKMNTVSTTRNMPMGSETVRRQERISEMRKELGGTASATTYSTGTMTGASTMRNELDGQISEIERLKKQREANLSALKSATAVTNAGWDTKKQNDEMERLKREKMKIEQDARTKQSAVASKYSIVQANISNAAKGIDLLFLMDCTGSMASWIKISKDKIVEIADSIKRQHSHLNLRLAFVAYRDFGDKNQIESRDFTTNADEMKAFISTLSANGGGDAPEDIAGGLESCLKLSWKSRARLIIHFADAPPHGKQYHSHHDNYPDGDPNNRVPEDLLKCLSSEVKVDYYFARLNSECDTMLEFFRKVYSSQDTNMKVVDVGESVDKFVPLVIQSVSSSVSSSMARVVAMEKSATEKVTKKTVY